MVKLIYYRQAFVDRAMQEALVLWPHGVRETAHPLGAEVLKPR